MWVWGKASYLEFVWNIFEVVVGSAPVGRIVGQHKFA